MGGLMFLPLVFLAVFSVSSTQISKPGIFKLEENKKPVLLLETKNEGNPGEEKEPSKRSLTQGKPGMLILQGQPGYSNQPGKPASGYQQGRPEVLNKPGMSSAWILQGKPGEENKTGTLHQEESRSPSQQGKLESLSQKGKPSSSKDQSKPEVKPTLPSNKGKPGSLESSNHQGKPGSSSQQGKPEPSIPQRKPRSLYKQEGKNVDNLLKDDTMGIKVSIYTCFIL
uniref:MARCO like n=1 Tax=Cricetulus griseus TaxID=10029 RepID=A0A8C2QH30_CRIGR